MYPSSSVRVAANAWVSSVLLVLFGMTPAVGRPQGAAMPDSMPNQLLVRNGDFRDLAGLADTQANGWLHGVPQGWASSATDTRYSVNRAGGPTPPTCNVAQLGNLEQAVGVLTAASDVVLSIDVSEPWGFDGGVRAAILDGAGAVLATSTYQAGAGQTLVAAGVPAGTAIRVQFAALWDTTPGLDNVTVTAFPPGSRPARARPRPTAPGAMGALDAAFRDPPNTYRIVQYSGHNGALLPISKMRDYGIGGLMLFMSMQNYLQNEQAWENMKTNIRLAKQAGMQVWVADDNGYPSGQAGGRVVEGDPALELRCLRPLTRSGTGPEVARIELPREAESFVSAAIYPVKDGRPDYGAGKPVTPSAAWVEATGLAGPWELHAFALQVNNDAGSPARGTMAGFGTTGRYPNLLDPRAAAKFVDLTHAEYARRLATLKGKVDAFYTNEPHLGATWHAGGERPDGVPFAPWHEGLPARFRRDHGYDLLPLLPALFGGDTDEAKLTRRHFYETVGNAYSDNVSGRIARWAEANGVRSGGHLLLEERMDMHVVEYGNFLRAIGDQQVPGCDVPMPDPGAYWNFWMPRLISSAAELRGRTTVSVLIDPIIDRAKPCLNPTPERTMRVVNMAALAGANLVTSYCLWERYTPDAYRRLNDQVGRLCVMLRGARRAATVALYYPIESFQAWVRPTHKNWGDAIFGRPEAMQALFKVQDPLIRGLYSRHIDFGWVDGDAVLAGTVRGGRLIIGRQEYAAVVMPQVELLPLAVLRKLQSFERAGGRVIWAGSVPRLGDAPSEHDAVRRAVASTPVTAPAQVAAALGACTPPGFRLRVEGTGEGLYVGRYVRGAHRLNYIVNNSADRASFRLRLSGAGSAVVWIYDPADGSIQRRSAPATLTIGAFAGLFVVQGPGPTVKAGRS